MVTGMLWYDDDPKKTLEIKIAQAAARYNDKYGHAPNACYVSPTEPQAGKPLPLRIVPARTVRPNYLWIGVEEANERA